MNKTKSGLSKTDGFAIGAEVSVKGPVPTAAELGLPDKSIAEIKDILNDSTSGGVFDLVWSPELEFEEPSTYGTVLEEEDRGIKNE